MAPQANIVHNVVPWPNLLEQRSREPKPLYPLLNGADSVRVERHMLAFSHRERGRFVRTAPPTQDRPVWCLWGGLPRGTRGIEFVGIVDTPAEIPGSSPIISPENGGVVRVSGTACTTNTGTAPLTAGCAVYWDAPEYVIGLGERAVPRIGKDFEAATKPLRPGGVAAYVANFVRVAWDELVRKERGGEPLANVLEPIQRQFALFLYVEPGQDPLFDLVTLLRESFPRVTGDTLFAFLASPAPANQGNLKKEADGMEAATIMRRILDTLAPTDESLSGREAIPGAELDNTADLFDALTKHGKDPALRYFLLHAFLLPWVIQRLHGLVEAHYVGRCTEDSAPGKQLNLVLG